MEDFDNLKEYLGIPRKEIPWFPTIDENSCTSCGICVDACKHETYAFNTDHKVIVTNPYNCEVFCESCKFQCPVGAISFPNRTEFKLIVKKLRGKYPPRD